MKNRLPLSLMSFLTLVLAFVAAIVSHTASADPQQDMFPVVGKTPDGRPVVEVAPGASMYALVQRYSALYKSTTGEDLTWQIIYAANAANIIPNCIHPAPGKPHWLGRGVESVWEGCDEKDKTAGLVAGASARITIPLAHVETYEERIARTQVAVDCYNNANCLQERLTALGVTSTPTDDSLAQKAAEQDATIVRLNANNDSLQRDNAALVQDRGELSLANAALMKKADERGDGKSSRPPWEIGLIGLGLVVGASGYSYRRGKQSGRKAAENALAKISPVTVALVAAPKEDPVVLRASHDSLTSEYNKLVKKCKKLEEDNERLKKQPVQQFNISAENVQINATPDARERATESEIRKPTPSSTDVADRPSQPLLPAVGQSAIELFSACIDVVGKTRQKIARRIQELVEKGAISEASTAKQHMNKLDRAVDFLLMKEPAQAPALNVGLPLPPVVTSVSHNEAELAAQIEQDIAELVRLGGATPISGVHKPLEYAGLIRRIEESQRKLASLCGDVLPPERISVPAEGHDASVSRITIPDHHPSPTTPSALFQQEQEIARLKADVNKQRTRADEVETLLVLALQHATPLIEEREKERRFQMEVRLRLGNRIRERVLAEVDRRIELHAEEALARYLPRPPGPITASEVELICALEHEAERADHATRALKRLNRMRYGCDEPDYMGVLLGKEYRIRELEQDLRRSHEQLRVMQEKRTRFAELWPHVQSMCTDVEEAKAAKRDTHMLQQLLDEQFAQVTPLFKTLTNVEMTDVMIVSLNRKSEPPPSIRSILGRVSTPPSLPLFDSEETVVPDGSDDLPHPTRNGKGRVHTKDYPIVEADTHSSTPEIVTSTNGPSGFPSPDEIMNDLKVEALLQALDPEKLPSFIWIDKRVLYRLRKFSAIPTKWAAHLPMEVSPRFVETLCEDDAMKKSRSLHTALNTLVRIGVFTPDTFYPTHEYVGLPPPDPNSGKNGA
ncbi:MAG: hypothetical protein ABIO72_04030 [Patescibacteria group bacterium]